MEKEAGNNNSAEFTNLETCNDKKEALAAIDNPEIKALEKKIANLEKENEENESCKREKDSLIEEAASLKSQTKYLAEDRDAHKKERDLLREEKEAIKKKLATVTSKLRDQIECPVCLEVPSSGPVYCCPNGHFVCSKCKDTSCPTCRSKMFNGKSLLAVTVIENIDHKCKNAGCEEVFPLAGYEIHLNLCQQRIISCPAPNQFCTKKVALSKVYDHIFSECEGSLNKTQNNLNDGKFPKTLARSCPDNIPTVSLRGLCFVFGEVKFYLNIERGAGYSVFSVQLLENADMCKDYEVTIAVHRIDDKDMKGKYVQRLVWEPLPVDFGEDVRKMNGLMIGHKMLEKIAAKREDKLLFSVTVDLKKSEN